jgi:hypothetical protein
MENNKIMEKETIKNIFNFLKKEDNINRPFTWMLLNNEPFTKEELNVEGDLDLTGLKIESLPEGLHIGGDLFLEYCSKLTSLPEGLKVEGNLDLDGCYIFKFLPKGLEIGGYLSLTHSDIKSLPEGLKVGGNLIITDTPLAKLSYDELIEMIKPGFIEGEIFK